MPRRGCQGHLPVGSSWLDGRLMHSWNPAHEACMWIPLYADDACNDIDHWEEHLHSWTPPFDSKRLRTPKVLGAGREIEALHFLV